jgi:hypothetical protein
LLAVMCIRPRVFSPGLTPGHGPVEGAYAVRAER